MDAYLKRRFQSLKLEAEERNLQTRKSATKECDQTKDLTEQIRDLMASLAPAQRDRLWGMNELLGRLKGKYRRHPHPQTVAAVLRSMGWKSIRLWGPEWQGRRMWKQTDKTEKNAPHYKRSHPSISS